MDGGETWLDGLLPLYPAGVHSAGDPALAFDASGNVYYASLGFPEEGSRCEPAGGIYVSKSSDGGLTWDAPVQVMSNMSAPFILFADKEYVAVDRSGGTYGGQIYISMTAFFFDACLEGYQSSPIVVATLTPGGAGLESLVQVGEGDDFFSQGSIPAVDSSGNLYVAYGTFDLGCPETVTQFAGEEPYGQQQSIHVVKSVDGGATFGAPVRAACQFGLPYYEALGTKILTPTTFRVNAYPSMATNPVNGHIYIVWTEWHPHTDADVHFIRSTDGGASWTDPLRVNDDLIGNGKDQFFPWVSVSPDGSRVDVVFYDRRDDPDNIKFHTYVSSSFDGGQTFASNRRVTSVASDPANDGFDGRFIGDYNGIVSTNEALHPAWTDTRRGEADVFYSRVAAATSSDPTPTMTPLPGLTQSGLIAAAGLFATVLLWRLRGGSIKGT